MERTTEGWIWGAIGMLIFSGSLPATRLAVISLDPWFLTAARAAIAGGIGLALLIVLRQPWPTRRDYAPLAIISLGVVVGFPLLSALALRHIGTAHSILFTGLLPLSTACFGFLRAGERPDPRFWLLALIGGGVVTGYALFLQPGASLLGDGLMLAAIAVCGLGYAEGGVLSRRLGGWQVICWALVLTLPLSLAAVVATRAPDWPVVGVSAWLGLGYVTLFSMLIGMMFWYRGLALGGIAAVGQLQLLQPFAALALAAALLRERIEPGIFIAMLAVFACVAGARHLSTPTRTKQA
jgi:drug/metabolite transporter (DMT)-like permease